MSISTATTRLRCALIVGLFLVLPTARADQPLSPQQQERLQQRNEFVTLANRLSNEGKLVEAIAAAEKAVSITRQVLGAANDTLTESLQLLASLQERHEDFAAARAARAEVLAIQTKLYGAQDWWTTNARLALAHCERLAELTAEQRGRLRQAEQLSKQVAELADKQRYRDAIPAAQQVVAIRKELLGEQSTDHAASLLELGWMYREASEYPQAEKAYRQAQAIYKKLVGEGHPAYGNVLNNMGWLHVRRKEYEKAEAIFRQAAELYKKAETENSAGYRTSLNNLAQLYDRLAVRAEKREDFAAARKARAEVVTLKTALYGAKDWRVTDARLALAYTERLIMLTPEQRQRLAEASRLDQKRRQLFREGHYREALPLGQEVLEIYRQVLGEDDQRFGTALNNLALQYKGQGDLERAEAMYRRACSVNRKVLGENHPGYGTELTNLGIVCVARGKYDEAEPMLRQAASTLMQAYGPRDHRTVEAQTGLTNLYGQRANKHLHDGACAEARQDYRQKLDIVTQRYGANSYQVTDARLDLNFVDQWEPLNPEQRQRLDLATRLGSEARRLEQEGKLDEARDNHERVVAIRKEILGEQHHLYGSALTNLAFVYLQIGDLERAEPAQKQALEICRQTLGENHPYYIAGLKNLASLYQQKGDFSNAEAHGRQALELANKSLGPTHYLTVGILNSLLGLKERLLQKQQKADDYVAAARTAQDLVALKTQAKGAAAWDIRFARLEVAYLEKVAQLDAEQRGRLSEATRAHERMKLLSEHGKYREALEPCQQAVQIQKELLGETDWRYATNLAWLGYLRMCLKDDVQAEGPYRQAADILHQVLGDTHPQTVQILKNVVELYVRLGAAYVQKEDFDAARKTYEALVQMRTRLYGASHWQVRSAQIDVDYVQRLAQLRPQQRRRLAQADEMTAKQAELFRATKYAEALALEQKVLPIYQELLGEKQMRCAIAHNNLGRLYYETGDREHARQHLLEALKIHKEIAGEHYPEYVTSLYNLTELYEATGEYDRAEALFRRALSLTQELGEQSASSYEGAVESLVSVYAAHSARDERKQDFAAARRAHEKIIALLTYNHGPAHWRVKDARLALAHLDRVTRLSPQQRQRMAEADDLAGKEAEAFAARKYREALPLARQILTIEQEVLGEGDSYCATWQENVGYLCYLLRDFAEAQKCYQQTLALREKLHGTEHPQYAHCLHSFAGIYFDTYAYDKAEALYQQALQIRKRTLGEAHADYGKTLNLLALVYAEKGRYDKAEGLLQKAVQIGKQTSAESYAAYLQNLAGVYKNMSDYARAQPLYEEAVQVCRTVAGVSQSELAYSLDNLAGLYRIIDQSDKAETLYKEALAIRKKILGEEDPAYVETLHNLAFLYLYAGDDARAEPLLQQVIGLRKRLFGEDHPSCTIALGELAWVYTRRGEFDRAEPLFQKRLEMSRKTWGDTSDEYASSLVNCGQFYDMKGEPKRAAPLYRQCLDVSQRRWEAAAASQSERQQLALTKDLRWRLDSYLSVAPRAELNAEDIYPYVLAWKGAVFDQQRWKREQAHVLRQRRPEVAALYDQLQSTASRLAALAFASPEDRQKGEWQRQVEGLTQRKEELESELARRSSLFRQHTQQKQPSLEQLRVCLPPGTALIDCLEYTDYRPPEKGTKNWDHPRQVLAFVVRREGVVRVELGPSQAIQDAVEPWRLALQRRFRTEGDAKLGAAVRRLLWQPLEPHVKGARVVLVSPDGILTRVPWAALPGSKPNSFLLEEMSLGVVPVPQLLPALLAPGSARTMVEPSLLVVGDVRYDRGDAEAAGPEKPEPLRRGALMHWQALDATRAEVVAIKDSFQRRFRKAPVTDLREDEATEAAVRQEAPVHRYLHLATHGFFAPKELTSALAEGSRAAQSEPGGLFAHQSVTGFNPGLLSGIVLAGANAAAEVGQDDGILTALEVEAMDLTGVELAVLSACETGLGEEAGGEGLLGLQRAFQVAGVRSVVAGLWQVDDKATRELMVRFYENLWKRKMPKLEALRQAQLWMLKEGMDRGMVDVRVPKERLPVEDGRLAPYYWAAFVLSGDWR